MYTYVCIYTYIYTHIHTLSSRDHSRTKDTHRLKVKGWKKIFHANGKEKKAGVVVLIFDKIYFKTKI